MAHLRINVAVEVCKSKAMVLATEAVYCALTGGAVCEIVAAFDTCSAGGVEEILLGCDAIRT